MRVCVCICVKCECVFIHIKCIIEHVVCVCMCVYFKRARDIVYHQEACNRFLKCVLRYNIYIDINTVSNYCAGAATAAADAIAATIAGVGLCYLV